MASEVELLRELIAGQSRVESDFAGGGVVSVKAIDELIFEGKIFTIQNYGSIPAGGTFNLLFNAEAHLPVPPDVQGVILSYPMLFTSSAAELSVAVYAGTDYAGGIPLPMINRNLTIATSPNSVLTFAATGTVLGLNTSRFYITPGNPMINAYENLPQIYNGGPGAKVLVEFTNLGAVPTIMEFRATIGEL